MVLRILTWIFPWQMAVFELLLRLSVHDSSPYAFIGPTIGGASLGMMLTLTRARERYERDDEKEGSISFDPSDDQLAQLATLALWMGFTAWACSLYLSLGDIGGVLTGLDPERTSNLIGFIIWSTVIVFDVVRGDAR